MSVEQLEDIVGRSIPVDVAVRMAVHQRATHGAQNTL